MPRSPGELLTPRPGQPGPRVGSRLARTLRPESPPGLWLRVEGEPTPGLSGVEPAHERAHRRGLGRVRAPSGMGPGRQPLRSTEARPQSARSGPLAPGLLGLPSAGRPGVPGTPGPVLPGSEHRCSVRTEVMSPSRPQVPCLPRLPLGPRGRQKKPPNGQRMPSPRLTDPGHRPGWEAQELSRWEAAQQGKVPWYVSRHGAPS